MELFCGPGAYAARVGVTLEGLRQAATRIPLPWQPGMLKVDIAENDRAWQAAYRRGQVKTPVPGGVGERGDEADNDLEAVKLRKESAQARNWEIRNEVLERKLIPAAEIASAWVGISAAIDGSFDSLAAKIAAVLPGDKREIMRLCRKVIEKERDDLGQRVEQLATEAEAESHPIAELLDEDEPAAPPPKKRGRPPGSGKKGGVHAR